MNHDVAVPYILGLVMLAGALIPDLIHRRVPNMWWIPFATAAVLLAIGPLAMAENLLSLGIAAILLVLFYTMWRFGLFGGADAKALMVLAILAPNSRHPEPLPVPPALDALANGSLLLVALPVAFVLYNAARGHWAPVMWLGVRMNVDSAEERHVWPMQVPTDDGRLKWRYWQAIRADLPLEYRALRKAGLGQVWATPKIPLMGAILVGLAASWQWGNLVVLLASQFLA